MLVTCGLHLLGRQTESRWRHPVHQLSAHPSKLKHLPTLHYSSGAEAVVIPGEKNTHHVHRWPWTSLKFMEDISYVTETNTDRRVKTESTSRPKHWSLLTWLFPWFYCMFLGWIGWNDHKHLMNAHRRGWLSAELLGLCTLYMMKLRIKSQQRCFKAAEKKMTESVR